MTQSNTALRFVFFGSASSSVIVLEELTMKGYTPSLIVTTPAKPQGRKLILTPTPVARYATEHHIPCIEPASLRDPVCVDRLTEGSYDLFVVVVYGKIIPAEVLRIPPHGTLNVHPSLLPKFSGPSPVRSVILSDDTMTGVSIIALDSEMDHGPILLQRTLSIDEWPPRGSVLDEALLHLGGLMLTEAIPTWISEHRATEQDHRKATFTRKITKEDGLIDLSGDPLLNFKKIRAYDDWPGAYFFTERNGRRIRVRVTDATFENGALTITRVIPEGKREMAYEDFLRGAR